MSNQGAQLLTPKYDTGSGKLIIGDGNDFQPIGIPPYEAGKTANMVVYNPATGEMSAGGATISNGKDTLRPVATACRIPNSTSASYTQLQSRTGHVITTDVSELTFVWYGCVFQNPNAHSGVAEAYPASASTLTATVEVNGVRTRITFSGSNSGAIPPGGKLTSDAIKISVKAGTKIWINAYQTNPSGCIYNSSPNKAGWGEASAGATSGLSDLTASGTPTDSLGTIRFTPAMILAKSSKPVFGILGDSRAAGDGDSSFSDTSMVYGGLQRIFGKGFATVAASISGEAAFNFVSGNSQSNSIRLDALSYCTHIICGFGINDLKNSKTAAQTIGYITSVKALFTQPFIVQTLPPESTSTDGWITTANQTTASYNAQRTSYNTNVRYALGGAVDGYIEMADAVESARNSGIWVPYATGDGLHESTTGCTLQEASLPAKNILWMLG